MLPVLGLTGMYTELFSTYLHFSSTYGIYKAAEADIYRLDLSAK